MSQEVTTSQTSDGNGRTDVGLCLFSRKIVSSGSPTLVHIITGANLGFYCRNSVLSFSFPAPLLFYDVLSVI